MTAAAESAESAAKARRELEWRGVAALLQFPEHLPAFLEKMCANNFERRELGMIVRAMEAIQNTGTTIDMESIAREMQRRGWLEKVGGGLTIADLFDTEVGEEAALLLAGCPNQAV